MRAERLDEKAAGESQLRTSYDHIRPDNWRHSSTSTCDDGEPEFHTSEMRVLSKAKLAAKRAAVKGVPKSTRDISLGEVEAAARKHILVSKTLSQRERDERKCTCKYCEKTLLLHFLTVRP